MPNDIRDWLDLALTVAPFVLSLVRPISARRHRRRERYRSFKGWGIEWTTYKREDDSRS